MTDGGAKKGWKLPPWAMGLAIAPMGFYYGFISTAMGILLAARGISVARIGEISSIAFLPTCLGFLLCPILDVRFSKRVYAIFSVVIAAICLGACTLLTGNLTAFTAVLTVGCMAAVLFSNAHQGWMPDVIDDRHYSHVGATTNISNLGAAGAFTALTVVLVRTLPPVPAAVLLALALIAPTAMLFFIPLPAAPTRGAAEVFSTFFRDLYTVCRRRDCIVGLICFGAPTACFALTNTFSGMGSYFHTGEAMVTAINGTGVAVACSLGCVAGIWFCSRFRRRTVYILTGFGSAAAALVLLYTTHAVAWYAGCVLAYNFCQGISYTAFSALSYEIVGPSNPLSGTHISLLAAAANAPITYMTRIEAWVNARYGLSGMLATDAISTLIVGTTLLFALRHTRLGRAPEIEESAAAAGR